MRAFAGAAGTIRAGATRTGDVVFDVPAGSVQTLLQHSALIVVDFGTTAGYAASAAVLKLY
jgi:hypothetical protein